MKSLFYIIVFLFVAGQSMAQLGDRFYGPGVFQNIQPSGDGNFYIIGTKAGKEAWLLKIDQNQNIIWEKTYSGPLGENAAAYHLLIDSNGDLLIMGTIFHPSREAWAIKTDKNGSVIWNKNYSDGTSIFHACQNGTGGYYFGGFISGPGSSDGGLMLNVNEDGLQLQSNRIEIANQTRVKYIEVNTDGTLNCIGRSNVIGAGYQGVFFLKLKKDGTELLRTTFDSGFREDDFSNPFYIPLDIVKKLNGNYFLANPYNYDSDCLLLEMDANGKIISTKVYGDASHMEFPYSLTELPDGDLLMSGLIQVPGNSQYKYSPFAIRVTPNGLEKFRKYYQQDIKNAGAFSGVSLPNGNLLYCGIAKDSIAWLFNTEADGNNLIYTINGKVVYDENGNCIADANEKPISNVLIKKKNGNYNLTFSDQSGNFSIKTDDLINDLYAIAPDEYTRLCMDEQIVTIDSSSHTTTVQFLISTIDNCSHLRVEITRPDLIKCQKSKYKVYVKNFGSSSNEPQELKIICDPNLTIVDFDSGRGGQLNQNILTFPIPVLQANEELVFEFVVVLSCNVLTGASHLVTAEVNPSVCSQVWNGPQLSIDGVCMGDHVKFTIQNVGQANMTQDAYYLVYADQYLIEQEPIRLNTNQSIDLEYESKGKTFHVDIQDGNSILPKDEAVYSTIEACGRNKNGIFSVAYSNAFHSFDPNEHRSTSIAFNSTGIPDRVQEMIEGLGYYHYITKNGWIEYTLRARNPLDKEVNQVEIQLNLSPTLDINTFQVLGGYDYTSLIPLDSLNMKILISNINLKSHSTGTDADLFFKFKIKSFDASPADSSERSFFGIGAKVFYDGEGPYELRQSRNNLTNTLPYKAAPADLYPEAISLFGGRYNDFGVRVTEGSDGSVFLLSQSSSYNDDFGYDGMIVKLDKNGQVIWYSVLPFRENHSEDVQDLVALDDGGCMLIGSSIALGSSDELINYEVMVARVNNNGELVWNKFFKPGVGQRGGYPLDIEKTKDGNYLVCGECSSGDNNEVDNFLMKVDPDGNLIWSYDYVIDGLAFQANQIFELENGDIICTGWDEGRSLIVAQKTDALGFKIWIKTVTPQVASGSYLPSSVITKDGEILFLKLGYWMDQTTGAYTGGCHFIKLSKDGNYLSEAVDSIGSPEFITKDRDGNFLVVGEIGVDTIKFVNAMLAKFDSNLNLLWYKDFGSSNYEEFDHVALDKYNFIHMIGYNQRMPPDYNLQTIYVKTNLNGEIVNSENISKSQNDDLLVFPNPAKNKVNAFFFNDSNINGTHWNLIDLNGHSLSRGLLQSNKLILDVQEFPQGIYILKFSNSKIPVQKIIIQH